MLNLERSYLAMFFMLDEYWDETKHDSLAAMLGSLNPFLFKDSISADPAAFQNWVDSVKKVTDEGVLTYDEAFQASLIFLKLYQIEFGFEVGGVIDELSAMTGKNERWINCIKKAREQQLGS
jgi:hypothetical protein